MVCEMSKSGTMESNGYGHESEGKLEPPEFDAEGQAEFDAIASMITEASKHSLQVEVVHSFGVARAAGSNVLTACREALYEWDI